MITIKIRAKLKNPFWKGFEGLNFGAPEPIRTADLFLRRELLYPAELREQLFIYKKINALICQAESFPSYNIWKSDRSTTI